MAIGDAAHVPIHCGEEDLSAACRLPQRTKARAAACGILIFLEFTAMSFILQDLHRSYCSGVASPIPACAPDNPVRAEFYAETVIVAISLLHGCRFRRGQILLKKLDELCHVHAVCQRMMYMYRDGHGAAAICIADH